jgi:hypothetical protein
MWLTGHSFVENAREDNGEKTKIRSMNCDSRFSTSC